MAICNCVNPEEPRDIVEHYTKLYQAVGGRLYRLHIISSASAIEMGDGMDVETRIRAMERMLLGNATIHFADNIAGRDALTGLTPGDLCYVFNAAADASVPYGGAMYIWLPALSWKKCFNGDSPIDAINMIASGGGLAVDASGKIYVDFSQIVGQLVSSGGGLALSSDGRLMVAISDLIENNGGLTTGSTGKLAIDMASLFTSGGGLALGSDGRLKVDFASMPAAQQSALVLGMIQTGGGLAVNSQGRIYFDPDSMDTAVFQKMLKALHLPQWLTANRNIYVDKSNAQAADTLDEGRGSQEKPFASIQAAVNYVCDNFNLGTYHINIQVASGQYNEFVQMGTFSSSGSGYLSISGPSASDKIVISGFRITQATGPCELRNVRVEFPGTPNPGSSGYQAVIATGTTLNLYDVELDGMTGTSFNKRLIQANAGSTIIVRAGCSFAGSCYSVLETQGGRIELYYNMTVNNVSTSLAFAFANGSGGINVSGSLQGSTPTFSGSATGYRYRIVGSGTISTGGQGADYFPGNAEGTVNTGNPYS